MCWWCDLDPRLKNEVVSHVHQKCLWLEQVRFFRLILNPTSNCLARFLTSFRVPFLTCCFCLFPAPCSPTPLSRKRSIFSQFLNLISLKAFQYAPSSCQCFGSAGTSWSLDEPTHSDWIFQSTTCILKSTASLIMNASQLLDKSPWEEAWHELLLQSQWWILRARLLLSRSLTVSNGLVSLSSLLPSCSNNYCFMCANNYLCLFSSYLHNLVKN